MAAPANSQTGPFPSVPERAAAPDTARRADTSLQATPPDGLDRTGDYVPATGADTSVTGGYTPADAPTTPAGAAAVAGYEILGLLGRGGMGVVYKARQVALDRVVALKMILAGPHASPSVLNRFHSEAQAVARLQHPNIVQIHEVGLAGGLPFFSLEFVDGGPLSRKIAHEPQPPRYAAQTVEALARAMQYAHEKGVLHRDLKPANVLLATDGTPKITDFGLAKRLEQDSGQTQEGSVLGTPSYMAPEQARGEQEKVGPPADIYSLGAMLYDLLTGRPPFAGSSVLDTLEMVRTREPVPPSQLAGKLPRDLETICLKCLQKDAAKRYASAGALADDLRRFLDGRPILARPVSAPERAWRWAKRNPWEAGLGSAVALLLVTVAVVTSILSWRLSNKNAEAEFNLNEANLARDAALIAQHREATAREDEHRARVIKDEQVEDALMGIREVVAYVDDFMRYRQSLIPTRKKIFEVMTRQLEKVRDRSANARLVTRTEAIITTRLGETYFRDNRIREAGTELKKTRDIFDRLVQSNPSDLNARRSLAGITNQMADVEMRLGNSTAGRAMYAEALKLRMQWWWVSRFHPDAVWSVAQSHGLIGRADLQLGDPESALFHFQAAAEHYSGLPAHYARDFRVRRERATNVERLGDCLWRTRQPAEAERHFRFALRDREALRKLGPTNPMLARDVALSRLSLGDLFVVRNELERAKAEYAPVYATVLAAARADPDDLNARRDLAAIHYRLGYLIPRVFTAFPFWADVLAGVHFSECLRLRRELARVDSADVQGQWELLLALARCGRAAEAEPVAKKLLDQAGDDRRLLVQVACGLSVAGTGTDAAAGRCRVRAWEVLGRVVDLGWKDRVTLETEPDLDAVRRQPGFNELLERVPGPVAE